MRVNSFLARNPEVVEIAKWEDYYHAMGLKFFSSHLPSAPS